MAVYGYTKNYKLIKPLFDTDTWHDYEYDNLDTIDAVLSAIFASGDWKGFWKANTHYDAGGVVIDQATDTMYKIMVEHTTSEATFAEEFAAHPSYYELWSPNNLAQDWAIKMDGLISNVDYSSKAYAVSLGLIGEGSAKEWAIGSGEIGDTGEYSAKKYATDAHNDYIGMTTDVNVVAVGSNIANVNAVGQSISNVNTVASNISDVNTVAGIAADVTTVSGIANAVSNVSDIESAVLDVSDNRADISTVAANISDINAVASISTDVSTVADNNANITAVAGNATNINSVAGNAANINAVAGNATNISAVNANKANIDTVAGNIANVNAVGGSVSNVNAVSGSLTNIDAVSAELTNIDTVVGISSDITAVAGNSSNINSVAANATNINTVAGASSDISTVVTNISNINNVVTNMAAIQAAPTAANNAANSAIDSANSANASAVSENNSHIWAEGTDAQVQALGGVHSSKVWAEQSTNANVDLSNLSETGETHFANPALTNSPYTTNRILEIPQDIKLELNNGTLTLKAGSKVYVPNGAGRFDVVTIASDIAVPTHSTSGQYLVSVNSSGPATYSFRKDLSYSGSTSPTGFAGNGFWFDTANNIIQNSPDGGTTWENKWSLPVAIATISNGIYTSIDQVFNGFGYIGSTVFALPGVKVQVPDGRNEDGSYNTGIMTLNSVATTSLSGKGNRDIILFSSGTLSRVGSTRLTEDGYLINLDNGSVLQQCVVIGKTYTENVVRISSFTPYTVDTVANSNASNFSQAGRSYLSGLGMPYDQETIDLLSTGAINSTITTTKQIWTAPKNGWIKIGNDGTTPIWCSGMGPSYSQVVCAAPNNNRCVIPLYKGTNIEIQTTSGTTTLGMAYFYTCKGEN